MNVASSRPLFQLCDTIHSRVDTLYQLASCPVVCVCVCVCVCERERERESIQIKIERGNVPYFDDILSC